MPSVQAQVYSRFSHDSVAVIGVNKSSSTTWLNTYSVQKAVTYPFIYDQTGLLFTLYEVGVEYGNTPPSYLIIDTNGIVRYRVDAHYNKIAEMAIKVRELLSPQ